MRISAAVLDVIAKGDGIKMERCYTGRDRYKIYTEVFLYSIFPFLFREFIV